MTSTSRRILALSTGALTVALTGCATGPALVAPEVPANLKAPAGQVLYLEALATGVQIYRCTPKAAQPDVFEWAFQAPEADLADRAGKRLGKHYAGPIWESADGSTVAGKVEASQPAPAASAIPWLLLSSKANTGSGVFASARSVQRVQTVGGVAPATGCAAASVGAVSRVPYTATYYFYRSAS